MRPVVFDPGAFGEYGGPANDGFAGTGTNKSSARAATWTRTFTNTTLLDVRGGLNYYHNVALDAGRRPQHQHRRRHSGREPRRLHQRPHQVRNRRLHESAARVLAEPAVGPLREDVEHRDHADAGEGQRTRSSPAASGATTRTSCCRRRTPAARAAVSSSTRPAPDRPRKRPRSPASRTRSARSCSTGRAASRAT